MVAVTRDLPRSADGLPMDWIEVPFGPLFPGLPGGLLLMFTLDGDAVAKAAVHSLVGGAAGALQPVGVVARDFARRIGGMDPLAPAAYRLLACRALEDAAGQEVDPARARARAGTLERERIASHLGWLGGFARQLGIERLARRASALQAALVRADSERIPALGLEVRALVRRIKRTPLLRRRLAGIGRLPGGAVVRGPVARAAGRADDARSADATYGALGFEPVVGARGDAFDRLQVRLGEIVRGLELIRAAGTVEDPGAPVIGTVSGTGAAAIETPRGVARLRLTLEQGRVVDAQLDTPSNGHLALVGPLVAQQELGDALIAVGSLDLSPWEAMG
ncbi:MAG: Ni Fe-hydrogenase III large subunit [Chromatiales bacterium 21-64-14]|nr:MAG: Ni Fe-hydrogenase III large subunit [Chromatiales bacterium 21-64-14]